MLNPFRYRGYYFDIETGFYFLQTRYYDPEVGRFINMDSIDYADPKTINGLNLYAYCNNNSVMNEDPSGHGWFRSLLKVFAAVAIVAVAAVVAVATAGTAVGVIAAGAAIGAATGTVINGAGSAINAAVNGATGEEIFDAFADGALSGSISGAASGALAASGVGIGGQMFGNALISGLEYSVTSAISGDFNLVDFGISLGAGAFAGFAGKEGTMFFNSFSKINTINFIRSGTEVLAKVTKPILLGGITGLIASLAKNLT